MSGKGDARRPCAVSPDELAENWRRAFGAPEPVPTLGTPPEPEDATDD